MDTEVDTHLSTLSAPAADPDKKWVGWAVWSGVSLVMALFAVFALRIDPGLLLGWVVGVIVAATMMLFGRK